MILRLDGDEPRRHITGARGAHPAALAGAAGSGRQVEGE